MPDFFPRFGEPPIERPMRDKDDPKMLERFIQWWEDPPQDHRNARSMGEDLLEWVLTHHPKMTVNQEGVKGRIKVTPELFSEMYARPNVKEMEDVPPERFR
jgi:hypothetical protein